MLHIASVFHTSDVYVSFYLLAINELNEVSETLKTTGYLVIEWTDQHLTWNSSDYGGIILSHWPQVINKTSLFAKQQKCLRI